MILVALWIITVQHVYNFKSSLNSYALNEDIRSQAALSTYKKKCIYPLLEKYLYMIPICKSTPSHHSYALKQISL